MMFLGVVAVLLGGASLALTFLNRRASSPRWMEGLRSRVLASAWRQRRVQPPIEVLARRSLGPKQGVAILRVGDGAMLVSLGEGGVNKLADLDLERVSDSPQDLVVQRPRVRSRAPRHLTVLGVSALIGAGVLTSAAAGPHELAAQAAPTPAVVQEPAPAGPAEPISVEEMQALAERLGLTNPDGDAAEPGAGLRIDGAVGMVVFLGLLAIVPTLVLLMTSFTRILIVLHFLRQALGTQSAPPGHLLAALALLLTAFVMGPTLEQVHVQAVRPWVDGEIEQAEMLARAAGPFRTFMLDQTRESDLIRFIELSQPVLEPAGPEDVPLPVLVSAFVTSELRTAFQIGFALFLPFVVIDVVAASVLMSMGMFMLPPVMVSLPLKLLLFVLVDGWGLLVEGLVSSFG